MKRILVLLTLTKILLAASGPNSIIDVFNEDLTIIKEVNSRTTKVDFSSRTFTNCAPYVVIITEYKDKDRTKFQVVEGALFCLFWDCRVDVEKLIFGAHTKYGTSFKQMVKEYLAGPLTKDPSTVSILRELAQRSVES